MDPFTSQRLTYLATKYQPNVFYDIGAWDPFDYHGAVHFQQIFRRARFYLFEANDKMKSQLEKSGFDYSICLLSDKDNEERIFYETKFDCTSGNSYYLENTGAFSKENRIEKKIKTKTLDTLVAELKWPAPDFIKIDTQGSEIDILKGASNTLKNCTFVLIEIKVQDYNQNSPDFYESINFMYNKGFKIFDITEFHYHSGFLNEIDFLFVKKDSIFANMIEQID